MTRVTCTLYSTWCIMICLVILILSLLLFIQSLYSLSKLPFTCITTVHPTFYLPPHFTSSPTHHLTSPHLPPTTSSPTQTHTNTHKHTHTHKHTRTHKHTHAHTNTHTHTHKHTNTHTVENRLKTQRACTCVPAIKSVGSFPSWHPPHA